MDQKQIEELARIGKQEYYKAWRKNNKEKVKAYNLKFWAKKALQSQEAIK
jgi:hypothetical protein